MTVQHYKDLRAWQKSIDLVELIYTISRRFPQEEIYGLTKQIRCAAVSIPSNIAEGQGRASVGEFRQFLGTARGSLYEVETQMYIAVRLGYVQKERIDEAFTMISTVSRMLRGLITALPDKRPGANNGPRITNHEQ